MSYEVLQEVRFGPQRALSGSVVGFSVESVLPVLVIIWGSYGNQLMVPSGTRFCQAVGYWFRSLYISSAQMGVGGGRQ